MVTVVNVDARWVVFVWDPGDRRALDPEPRGRPLRPRDSRYNLTIMRIAVGADHAGFALKVHLVSTLIGLGHQVDDHGTDSEVAIDYPPICASVARAVAAGGADRGIVIGGSGQGEQIAANK